MSGERKLQDELYLVAGQLRLTSEAVWANAQGDAFGLDVYRVLKDLAERVEAFADVTDGITVPAPAQAAE